VEDPAGRQWPLVPTGSNQSYYSTPITTGVPDSGNEGLSYQGETAFTYYASDTTDTVSLDRSLYFYPVSHLPVQDSPLGVQVGTTIPTLFWHNVNTLDPMETDYLLVRILDWFYFEVYSALLSPGMVQFAVPAGLLSAPQIYCWEITAVRTGYGGDPVGRGTGFKGMNPWPLISNSSCFQVSP
jgi:hypothetical protein